MRYAELYEIVCVVGKQYILIDTLKQDAAGANQPGFLPGGYPWPTGFKNGVYVTGGSCYNLEEFLLISSGLSILTDIFMLLIPIYMVYDLQLAPKKKTVVLLVLCMGLGYVFTHCPMTT